jgi:hypothetical protein
MSRISLAKTLKGGGFIKASGIVETARPAARVGPQQQQISLADAIPYPDPSSLGGLPPQGIIMALMMLNQLEASLGKEFDDRMKLLSSIGKAIGTVAKALVNLVKQSVAEYSSSLFNLPVSYDDAPLEGAAYKPGKRVFAGEEDSRVSAVLRIQWTVSIDPAKMMGLPSDVLGDAKIRMMVPGGFIYLLQKDSAGVITQVPVVPKIEFGAGLEGESEAMKMLKAEIKTETEFESAFFWLQNPPLGGYRYLSATVNLFNEAMSALGNIISLGLQSCEQGGSAIDPSGTGPSRSNIVPVTPPD